MKILNLMKILLLCVMTAGLASCGAGFLRG